MVNRIQPSASGTTCRPESSTDRRMPSTPRPCAAFLPVLSADAVAAAGVRLAIRNRRRPDVDPLGGRPCHPSPIGRPCLGYSSVSPTRYRSERVGGSCCRARSALLSSMRGVGFDCLHQGETAHANRFGLTLIIPLPLPACSRPDQKYQQPRKEAPIAAISYFRKKYCQSICERVPIVCQGKAPGRLAAEFRTMACQGQRPEC